MAIIHNLKATMKVVVTSTRLSAEYGISRVPRTDVGQGKNVVEFNNTIPALYVPDTELKTRLADMMNVLKYGYRVDPLQAVAPPVVETKDATGITAAMAVLNGNVTGAGCTCGFQFGTTKELTTGGGTVVATTGSPTGVQSTVKGCTYLALGLVTKTTYYFRFFAQYTATGNTQYGLVRSFVTL